MEAVAEAVRAGYVPVYAAEKRSRQERRKDERTRNPVKPMRARQKSDKLKKLLGHE